MTPSSTKPLLLLVDDIPANLHVLVAALKADYRIKTATSGPAALDIVAQQDDRPELILLDLMMPEMDGYETCRQLKADPLTRDIPVLFLTAKDSAIDEARALETGAADFVSKPANPLVLRARIKTHLTLYRQTEMLRSLAYVDPLTGLANRRQFDEAMQREWRACQRSASPLSLITADVDYFKQVNDRYGHPEGDRCLQALAGVFTALVARSHDLAARIGGEELSCLLPDTELAGAAGMAEALRQAVEALRIPHEGSAVAPVVTVSLGVATLIPSTGVNADRLLGHADAALYQAKAAGRNRVARYE